jgi:hypothetical protein
MENVNAVLIEDGLSQKERFPGFKDELRRPMMLLAKAAARLP